MSASMIAPSLGDIAHDLRISASTAQITLSAYFLGMAFAPLLIASLSEMYGRKRVWVACNAWYVLWNVLCPVGNKSSVMIVGRIMTGAGSCVGITVCNFWLIMVLLDADNTCAAQWTSHG
jgi:predicted MFS family arabinose efflux permease